MASLLYRLCYSAFHHSDKSVWGQLVIRRTNLFGFRDFNPWSVGHVAFGPMGKPCMMIRQSDTGSLETSCLKENKERRDLLPIIPLEGTLSWCSTTFHGSSCYSWSLTWPHRLMFKRMVPSSRSKFGKSWCCWKQVTRKGSLMPWSCPWTWPFPLLPIWCHVNQPLI